MIRVAVFSDTHGNVGKMLDAVRKEQPDLLIHLGDYERDAELLHQEFPDIPLHSVRGNCDMAGTHPDTLIVPIGPIKAFLTHGHLFNVKWSVLSLLYAAAEEGCSLCLFGHTHEAVNENCSGVCLVNPGTAGQGRNLSWAMIRILDNKGIDVSIRPL